MDIFSIIKPGDIISVRGEDKVGKIIRWVTESNINHTALYIGSELIIESGLGKGVRILPLSIYLKDRSKEIYVSRVSLPFDVSRLIKLAYTYHGHKYDLFGQTGILLKYLVKKFNLGKLITFWGKNKAADYGVWCSEFIGMLFLDQQIRFTNDDTSYLAPNEIFNSTIVKDPI
jgi:hypothetical protein